jgi:hypothetical protein
MHHAVLAASERKKKIVHNELDTLQFYCQPDCLCYKHERHNRHIYRGEDSVRVEEQNHHDTGRHWAVAKKTE